MWANSFIVKLSRPDLIKKVEHLEDKKPVLNSACTLQSIFFVSQAIENDQIANIFKYVFFVKKWDCILLFFVIPWHVLMF